ncbi:hypothetical protein ACX0HA_01120 [Flavobacterium hauense]
MKKTFYFLPFLLCFMACEKNDDDSGDSLPEATQTGIGTFACHIDGKSFIDPSNQYFNCAYQNVNGDYYFEITAEDKNYKNTTIPLSIHLYAKKKKLEENKTYILTNRDDGNVTGSALFSSDNSFSLQETNPEYTGELTITRLGTYDGKNIASGTFWFNVKHPKTGDTVKVRDGRFDTLFIR